MEDGGWGETYMVCFFSASSLECWAQALTVVETDDRSLPFQSCVLGVYCQHSSSQVVQTAWAILSLISARYPEREPIERAVKLLMDRQLDVRHSTLISSKKKGGD